MLTEDRPITVGGAPTGRNHEFLFIEGDRMVGRVYTDCLVVRNLCNFVMRSNRDWRGHPAILGQCCSPPKRLLFIPSFQRCWTTGRYVH